MVHMGNNEMQTARVVRKNVTQYEELCLIRVNNRLNKVAVA